MTAEISRKLEVNLSTSLQSDSSSTVSSRLDMGSGDKRSYTLSYFDVRGRAEPSRMLFALAEVKFTDKRISYLDWPQLKPKTPYGHLPTLEVCGGEFKTPMVLHQTHSIERYLAREFGLVGRNVLEGTKIDVIVETMREAIGPIAEIFNEQNENVKSEVLNAYSENVLPPFLDYLSKELEDEWFVSEVSLADVAIYVAFDNINMFVPDVLEDKSYWKLREWKSRFESLPAIAEWIANRPVTAY